VSIPQPDPGKIFESEIPVRHSGLTNIVGVSSGRTQYEINSGEHLFSTTLFR
jgi:hypothetical protein